MSMTKGLPIEDIEHCEAEVKKIIVFLRLSSDWINHYYLNNYTRGIDLSKLHLCTQKEGKH